MAKHYKSPTPRIEGVPWFYPGSAVRKNSFVLSSVWPDLKRVPRSVASVGAAELL